MGKKRVAKKIDSMYVLQYSMKPKARATVRKHYDEWRRTQGVPQRCDIEGCILSKPPLVWNGLPLTLTLDHISGDSGDNRCENLRLLCPNCDAQLDTKGGANRGRIRDKSETGYGTYHKSGRIDRLVKIGGVSAKSEVGALSTVESSLSPPDKISEDSSDGMK